MNKHDFDAPVDRRGTDSLKWEKYKDRDIQPLWVADMDFRSPPVVVEALRKRIEHGIFGYTVPPPALTETICRHLTRQYGWEAAPEWILWLPGLVTGLNLSCRAVGAKGSGVITSVPIYPPFLRAPRLADKKRIDFSMIRHPDGRWGMDLDELAGKITPQVKLLLLCNPHNPTGRMFDKQELIALASVCEKYGTVICSDEIHCDLVLEPDRRHVPLAAIDPVIARRVITLMAPSKTYNIPGLGVSFAVIPDEGLRKRFRLTMEGIVPAVNTLGYVAAMAAYSGGKGWLDELLPYLRRNRDLVEQKIRNIDGLSMAHVEATYLAWIDCRDAGLDNPATFFEQAGVGLSDGSDFGAPGFLRLNFACRRVKLEECLNKMHWAMAQRHGTTVKA
ncbi:MAG: MalY/PatB family protein [Thermodesulfobacteriota bacterium]